MAYAHLQNLRDVMPGVRSRAMQYDLSGDWPDEDMRVLARAGAMRWAGPMQLGGADLSPLELHFRYEAVAAASLSTALILTQRDSAVAMIADAPDFSRRDEILRRLCANEIFATVGIAQLTTSRRHGPAALRARRAEGGWTLDGFIPWSTGAAKAAYIVAGAAAETGGQILFVLPTDLPGITIGPPMPLVALRSTWTGEVKLDGVHLDDTWVLRGPAEQVLANRSKSLPAGQAFLATGLCQGALDLIAEHPSERAFDTHQKLGAQLEAVRSEMMNVSDPAVVSPDPAAAVAALRGQCNELALRICHTAVTLYKGSALLTDHSAQRLAREAMFLLVWSCPSPVVDCTLKALVET